VTSEQVVPAGSATRQSEQAASGRRFARGRIADIVCIAISGIGALILAGAAEDSGRVTGEAQFWALVLAGVGTIALWWRRRHPTGVAVLLAPIAAVSEMIGFGVLIAVGTVAIYRRWPVAVAVAGLHAVVTIPYTIINPDPDLPALWANLFSVALLAGTVATGIAVRSRRELVASLRDRATRAEEAARFRADQVRALERERIAREMHDVLAHRISLVSLYAGALEVRPDLSATQVAAAAGTIRASAHAALEELREILGMLRSDTDDAPELRPQPSLTNLDELVEQCRRAGTPVEVDNQLPPVPLPPTVDRAVYRLLQEGLTNARKHAPGAPVRLRLDRTDAGVHIWLRNPLVGGPAPVIPGTRSGLVGLAERVSLAGGRLDHGVRRGASGETAFHLEAWLPWPA